jgi:hypothetical protein
MFRLQSYSVIWAKEQTGTIDICRRDFVTRNEAIAFARNVIDSGNILSLEVVDKNDLTIFEMET